MKTFSRVCRLGLSSAAVAGCLITTAFAQEDELVGDWSCTMSTEDQEIGASLSAEFEQTYESDGTYEREGDIRVVIAAFEVDIAVSIAEAGTWRLIDAMTLGETATDLEFSSAEESPSQVEAMMLEQMQAEADAQAMEEQTTEIVSLTATMLELQDPDGAVLACEKT
jgi:hypothetical protein